MFQVFIAASLVSHRISSKRLKYAFLIVR